MDWYPWGEEAFQKAGAENKPVLLSIGYSSCHWCHVMERESFENEATARLMNDNFVNIKVDREERPDVDHIYMEAVQAITGRGGWPLTVFLTPRGEPFFGGAYFPPEDGHGLPAFPKVLRAVADAYHSDSDKIQESAGAVRSYLEQLSYQKPTPGPLSADTLQRAYLKLAASYDQQEGGFGDAPKFPQPMALEFPLRYHHRTGQAPPLAMVEKSLEKMAGGGLYDQLGGGFHRYSTDAVWLAPHFEKMLYDNALLSLVYVHAYQVTRKSLYQEVATGTLEYVLREMTGPDGGFFSAQDADTEGEEGKYYLWTMGEVEAALGADLSRVATRYYGVTTGGNYERKNVLHVSLATSDLAAELHLGTTELEELLKEARGRLLVARERRVKPGTDEKVLASWNGLMMASLSEAGRVFKAPRYIQAAERNAFFLLKALWRNGKLLRTHTAGVSKIPAFLEDYAFLGGGLLTLYEATLDPAWLEPALKMAGVMVDEFWDESGEVFFDTSKTGESTVVRPRNVFDNALPSGSSQAASLLLRLGLLTGNSRYTRLGTRAMESMVPHFTEQPLGFGHWLCALDFHLSHPLELAIAGPRSDPRAQALLDVAYDSYLPNRAIAGRDEQTPPEIAGLPLLEGRTMLGGNPTAYLCQAYRCLEPATTPAALAALIANLPPNP